MPWSLIIEMILKLLEQCNKTDGRDRVFKRLRNPGLRERMSLRLALKREGLSGSHLNQVSDQAMDDLEAASDTEINDLLDSLG